MHHTVSVLSATEPCVGCVLAHADEGTSGKWTRVIAVSDLVLLVQTLWLSQARDVPTDTDP